jgi:DNA repair protein RecN (Recombination protein N)
MLVELHIRDFALVDELAFELGAGFSVLTGETGAGKSIIVDALGTALGERTGTEVIRTGAEKCLVEAVFDVSDCPAVLSAAAEYGFEIEDNALIVSREIARSGRSQARVNGRPATAAALRSITSLLVDVHGQHEHQSLLLVSIHVDILDTWIGTKAADLRQQTEGLYSQLQAVRHEQDRLQTDERDRARLLDLYQFQLTEIESARLEEGEDESLAAERNRLANAEKLYSAASELHDALSGADGSAVDRLSAATRIADRIEALDPSMNTLAESLSAALINAQEAAAIVRGYIDEVEANPARLEQVDERLELIRVLKRKYGDTIGEVLTYATDLAGKLGDLSNADERSSVLSGQISELETQLAQVCAELTALRRHASGEFEKRVEAELADLAMEKTRFEVAIGSAEPGPTGADAVEFLISPNPGEHVKPLARIASGGEMSRIMLALKTVMARSQVPTMIFDEIDSGIGGRTAQVLGDKLATLARKCQVMCVTHLPQVASKAQNHYSVSKTVHNDRTRVRLSMLSGEDRVGELARMLGADETSDTAAQHAREMLSLAGSGNG